jgi:hypothetical protein
VDIRQLSKVQGVYWRKCSGRSPMAKVSIGENLIGEERVTRDFNQERTETKRDDVDEDELKSG